MDRQIEEKLLNMTLKELKTHRSVRECARDLGYQAHGQVAERIKELGLGIDSSELGLSAINRPSRVLSVEDFEELKESLSNKKRTGRKLRKVEKEEVNQ